MHTINLLQLLHIVYMCMQAEVALYSLFSLISMGYGTCSLLPNCLHGTRIATGTEGSFVGRMDCVQRYGASLCAARRMRLSFLHLCASIATRIRETVATMLWMRN